MSSARRLWETFFSFSAIQGALIFLPLLAVPYLARVLQPDAFGQLMYLLTVSMVIGIVVEWGFALGGTRSVAMSRTDLGIVQRLVYGVLTAKIFLAALCIVSFVFIKVCVPTVGGTWLSLAYATGYGIILGFNPTWYYQGLGKGMRGMALWDVGSSAIVLLLMFLIIHKPDDGSLYVLLLFACKGICYTWLNFLICRKYPLTFSPRMAWKILWQVRVFFLRGSPVCCILKAICCSWVLLSRLANWVCCWLPTKFPRLSSV
ncbi:MAG: oligosaccharide flippase family protein [Desulfovibrionaceae bacterium]